VPAGAPTSSTKRPTSTRPVTTPLTSTHRPPQSRLRVRMHGRLLPSNCPRSCVSGLPARQGATPTAPQLEPARPSSSGSSDVRISWATGSASSLDALDRHVDPAVFERRGIARFIGGAD
jgi:hypothetical protein